MAYAVAKELKLRPMEILTGWTCEELLVAYGVYMNQRSQASFETLSRQDKARRKISDMDRWAIPFISYEQLEEIENPPEEKDYDNLAEIGKALFGF